MHELPVTLQGQIYTEEEVNKLTDAEKHILNRLQITKEQLSKYPARINLLIESSI